MEHGKIEKVRMRVSRLNTQKERKKSALVVGCQVNPFRVSAVWYLTFLPYLRLYGSRCNDHLSMITMHSTYAFKNIENPQKEISSIISTIK